MDSLADSMQTMILGNYLCHTKCKLVHTVLHTAQLAKQHLQDYETVPPLGNSGGTMKPFCFRIGVKSTVPLRSTHKVVEVSVSIPMDAMGNRVGIDDISANFSMLPNTIEIMLVDSNGETVCSHPRMSDIRRLGSVAELMLFLDKLANDTRSPSKDSDDGSADNESADEEDA